MREALAWSQCESNPYPSSKLYSASGPRMLTKEQPKRLCRRRCLNQEILILINNKENTHWGSTGPEKTRFEKDRLGGTGLGKTGSRRDHAAGTGLGKTRFCQDHVRGTGPGKTRFRGRLFQVPGRKKQIRRGKALGNRCPGLTGTGVCPKDHHHFAQDSKQERQNRKITEKIKVETGNYIMCCL